MMLFQRCYGARGLGAPFWHDVLLLLNPGGQGLVFVVIEKILWRDGVCQFVFGRKLPNFVGW